MADVDMAEASDAHPRVEEVVGEITGGQVELVNLDGCNLTTAGLESVLSALKNDDCSANLMAITLANNQLTDDACSLLLGALRVPTFCPSLLTINLQDNPRLTDQGFAALHEIVSLRTDLQITYKDKEIGAPDDVGLETFKKGAVLQEEEQKHAEPHAQWEALTNCIRSGASISNTAAVMREICDAVDHEVSKEEAIDPVEIQAQGGVTVTRQIQLPPGPYCKYAAEGQLPVLAEIFRLQPLPVQTAAQRRPVAGVGSHRFHASALVCLLVRCACDPRHHSPDTPVLLDAVVNSLLLPRVAHLAFASPSCSCLHTAFLDALSIHTLPQMPAAVWQPLLLENFGLPPETDGVVLDPLPDLLFSHASTALRTDIGRRSGLVGMVIQLARDLHLACEDNTELREALEGQKGWRDLLLPNGPLSKLLSQQQGSLAGGKPNTSSLQGMVEDEIPANQMHLRALFGVREYSQMHQSLSLGIPLQQ